MDDLDHAQERPIAPRWAGRVPKWKIARLYENDATGVLDEELIDDVAYAFLDALTLGEHNDPCLRQGHEAWRYVQQRRLTETERRLEAKRKQRGR